MKLVLGVATLAGALLCFGYPMLEGAARNPTVAALRLGAQALRTSVLRAARHSVGFLNCGEPPLCCDAGILVNHGSGEQVQLRIRKTR
jgi:hypothetical protein